MHEAQPIGSVIQARYKILSVLGQGGSGLTYRAEDTSIGHLVALKELSLRGLRDWKKLELFEREARVLRQLDHAAIPKYIDYFQVDTPSDRLFYIVQEIAEGQSLADWVAAGVRFSERAVRQIALEVLQVLQYLHSLNPPVVHRDIKPQNIIRREDGRIFLVDFGAVQTVYREATALGSTVIGTYGYMAPEQFRGQSYPATDLYGLGATLLHLLTHQNPGELPEKRLKLDFRPYITVSPEFADWLEGLLEPVVEDRYASAAEAIAALTHPLPGLTSLRDRPSPHSPQLPPKPAGSQVRLTYNPHALTLQIPPLHWRGVPKVDLLIMVGWNAISGFLLWLAGTVVVLSLDSAIGFIIFVPYWAIGLWIVWIVVDRLSNNVSLEIDQRFFKLTYRTFGRQKTVKGKTSDLQEVTLTTAHFMNGKPVKELTLQAGEQQHRFGKRLSNSEKNWLVAELALFIRHQHKFNR